MRPFQQNGQPVTYHDHLGYTVAEAPPHTSARTTPLVWLTRPAAAEYLGVHINTLDRHIKAGTIPAHRIGRAVRLHRAELDATLRGGTA